MNIDIQHEGRGGAVTEVQWKIICRAQRKFDGWKPILRGSGRPRSPLSKKTDRVAIIVFYKDKNLNVCLPLNYYTLWYLSENFFSNRQQIWNKKMLLKPPGSGLNSNKILKKMKSCKKALFLNVATFLFLKNVKSLTNF